jgi:hypothetical protein
MEPPPTPSMSRRFLGLTRPSEVIGLLQLPARLLFAAAGPASSLLSVPLKRKELFCFLERKCFASSACRSGSLMAGAPLFVQYECCKPSSKNEGVEEWGGSQGGRSREAAVCLALPCGHLTPPGACSCRSREIKACGAAVVGAPPPEPPSQQPSPRGAPSGLQEPVADTAGEGAKAADPPESKGDETARNKDRYQVAGWCARISHVAWVRCAAAREGVSVLPAIPLTEAYVGPCALTSLRRCLSSF